MRKQPIPWNILQRGFITLITILLCSFQITSAGKTQSVFVFAARDSRLLTMNPRSGEVALPGGKTWKSDNNAMVRLFKQDEMIRFVDESRVIVRLPQPAADLHDTGVVELDRIAPDAAIKGLVEKALAKRKEYTVTDSPDKADLVFLVEGTYLCLSGWDNPGGRGGAVITVGADREANFLQAALAIAVPADAYRKNPGDGTALMAARIWEGSVVHQFAQSTLKSASVEDLVGQFLNEKKRPRSHFPLCAATGHPMLLAESFPEELRIKPVLRSTVFDASALPEPKAQAGSNAIKVDVSLVTVPVTVTDISGRFVPDLKPSEFHIFENDQVQKIDRLITAAQPFDVALMLDTSASMFMKAEEIQLAALRFVDALRRDDRLVIASFNDRVFVHSELEGDPAKIRPAILQIGRGEGTRVYDAIDLVMRDRLDAAPGRKAIVLFTDGADTRSRIADAAAVLACMQESQVLAYAIQYDTQKENRLRVPNAPGGQGTLAPKILPQEALDTTAMYARATEFLKDLSETSGGRVYRAQALGDLDQAFAQIAEELSLQYTLCYYPRNQNKDGTFRRIRVEVDRPGVKVRARPGYLAARKPW